MIDTQSRPRRVSDFVYLTALCTVAYFVSYISRINMGAVMVEMVASGFSPRATVALALSICSVTYGAGQIASGYLGDRFRPQSVIMCGFLLTGAANLAVSLLNSDALLVAVWAVNGFAQSLMWPPMLAILAQRLHGNEYSRSCKWVSWGSAFGTIAVYACTPLLLTTFSFKSVFLVSGVVALTMAAAWMLLYERRFRNAPAAVPFASADSPADAAPAAAQRFDSTALVLMVMVMLAIVMQGALRDGVTNWMPTLVSESFNLSSSAAILSGVLLPVFHILCTQAASAIYERFFRTDLLCAGVIFTVALAAALLMRLLSGSVLLTVVLLALLVGCMHAINYVLICIVPRAFARYGHVALVSGVLNSSTYVGSAISTYGIALISESFGWGITILMWAAIAGAGALICLCLWRRWKSFAQQ